MMTSPRLRSPASCVIVCSVGSPDGTITHTARGALSAPTRSASDAPPLAPPDAAVATALASRSKTTTWWPPRMSRVVMFAPILPSPTIPICMRTLSSCRSSAQVEQCSHGRIERPRIVDQDLARQGRGRMQSGPRQIAGHGNTAHPRREGRFDARLRVLYDQTVARCHPQPLGAERINLRIGFRPLHLVTRHDHVEVWTEPQCVD